MTEKESLAALWRAFPQGYLPRLGVRTVAGWVCTEVEGDLSIWTPPVEVRQDWRLGSRRGVASLSLSPEILQATEGFRVAKTLVETGDFLPRVDPQDVATFSCCLAELYRRKCGQEQGVDQYTGCSTLLWWGDFSFEDRALWHLSSMEDDGACGVDLTHHEIVCLGKTDPASALIAALSMCAERA